MRPATRRLARVTVYGGSLLAVAALAFACSLQSDTTGPKAAAPRPQPTRVTSNQSYFEFQVEKQAQLLPNNTAPRYPDQLRVAHVEGSVKTQFVVDTAGLPIMETVRGAREHGHGLYFGRSCRPSDVALRAR